MATPNVGAFTGTAAALGTVTNTAGRSIIFKYTTNGAETVSLSGIVAAAVASTGKIMCYSLATGALHSTVDMVAGTYYIPVIYTDTLVFTGSSTSDAKVITYRFLDGAPD